MQTRLSVFEDLPKPFKQREAKTSFVLTIILDDLGKCQTDIYKSVHFQNHDPILTLFKSLRKLAIYKKP